MSTAEAIRPQAGPQEAFASTPADIAFIGGAAGGGKTYSLLIEPLRHIMTVPGFGSVFFRRESPQITAEGGAWDQASDLYLPLGARYRQSPTLDFRFPPFNNTIRFSHMQTEDDRKNWLGSQIPLILFDQLETFTRKQFFYMLSRNRSTSGIRPYVRAGYNPVPSDDSTGGWIHEFVGWYLDDEGEYPDPSKSGIIRWFINLEEKLFWYESEEEALEAWPGTLPTSFTFIPSWVEDNKILLDVDPGYLARLDALDKVERERLKKGNHKIRPEAGSIIDRTWFVVVDSPPPIVEVIRFWDFAASEKKIKAGAATASVKLCRDSLGGFGVLDMTEDWIGASAVDDFAVSVARADGRQVKQRWEEEGGSSGKRTTAALVKKMAGLDAAGIRPTGDKLDRLRPFAAQVRARVVWLLRADWNDRFMSVMHNTPEGLWDVRDATSGGFTELTLSRRRGVLGQGRAKVRQR